MLEQGLQEARHVAEAEVGDAVVVVEEDVEGVQGPGGLHQQPGPQGHHKPAQHRRYRRKNGMNVRNSHTFLNIIEVNVMKFKQMKQLRPIFSLFPPDFSHFSPVLRKSEITNPDISV